MIDVFYDIAIPKNNEKDFIDLAEKLQIDGICFAYPFSDGQSAESLKSQLAGLQKQTKVKLKAAFIAEGAKIHKVHGAKETAISPSPENSRETIEKYSPEIAYNLELSQRNDFAKAKNSGLDKPTCQFAREKNVIIAFSFSSILNSANQQQILGRMMQNIKLCKKYKVKTAIASFASEPYDMRSPHELKSFLLSFGMDTNSSKQSMEIVSDLIEKKHQ